MPIGKTQSHPEGSNHEGNFRGRHPFAGPDGTIFRRDPFQYCIEGGLMSDITAPFMLAIAKAGLTPPIEIIDDGAIHRFSSNGKPSSKSGWYMLHTDGIAAGAFGDWRVGLTQNWCGKTDTSMTEAERSLHRERSESMQRQRELDLAQRQRSAASEAIKRWTAATPCTHHLYLTRKGVQPHRTRIEADKLLIAMRDTAGTVHSVQTIAPDGTKLFMRGGRVKGCYFGIGQLKDVLIVCEGFATGASIHECTGHGVAVAFNAGNLEAVAVAMRTKYPALKIIVAADDDHQTPGNPGMTKAKVAVQAAGATLAVPLLKGAAA
jgi:putative DNA primase/helicase